MIFVTGDCHGDYKRFSVRSFPQQQEMDRRDLVIIAGDFGYWDHSTEQEYWMKWLADKDFTIAFVDGNHENYDMLAELPVECWKGGKVQFIRENVIHLMRGQMYRIQGKRFFTFGGARSHDIRDGILEADDPKLRRKVQVLERAGALYRINHLSWWKEEMPGQEEYEEGRRTMEENEWTCDYVISHCAPSSVQALFSLGEYKPDELTGYLEELRSRCRYNHWFFGHYHRDEPVDEKHDILYHRVLRVV